MKKILLLIILSALIVPFGHCQESKQPLQLVIKSDKEVCVGAEAIKIEVSMKNISNEEVIVWHAGFWANHKIVLLDKNKKTAPLTDFGKRCRGAFNQMARDKNARRPLAPGQEDKYEFELNKLYLLDSPGIYYLTVTYEESQPDGWIGSITSTLSPVSYTHLTLLTKRIV